MRGVARFGTAHALDLTLERGETIIDVNGVILILGFFTIIGVAVGVLFWIRLDMQSMEARLRSEMQGLKTDIKAVDNRLRLVENGVSYIRGFLDARFPGFRPEEPVTEAAGD